MKALGIFSRSERASTMPEGGLQVVHKKVSLSYVSKEIHIRGGCLKERGDRDLEMGESGVLCVHVHVLVLCACECAVAATDATEQ